MDLSGRGVVADAVGRTAEVGTRVFSGHDVRAVDTTGAGDTFNGALASALSAGDPIEVALGLANAAAAISVTKAGAQSSIPNRNDVEAFMGDGVR